MNEEPDEALAFLAETVNEILMDKKGPGIDFTLIIHDKGKTTYMGNSDPIESVKRLQELVEVMTAAIGDQALSSEGETLQ